MYTGLAGNLQDNPLEVITAAESLARVNCRFRAAFVIKNWLKGVAKQWAWPYRNLAWEPFKIRFLAVYKNERNRRELTAELYAQVQGPKEGAEAFLLNKQAIGMRLCLSHKS